MGSNNNNNNKKPPQPCPDENLLEMINSMVTFTSAANNFMEKSKRDKKGCPDQEQEKLQCILNNINQQMQELTPPKKPPCPPPPCVPAIKICPPPPPCVPAIKICPPPPPCVPAKQEPPQPQKKPCKSPVSPFPLNKQPTPSKTSAIVCSKGKPCNEAQCAKCGPAEKPETSTDENTSAVKKVIIVETRTEEDSGYDSLPVAESTAAEEAQEPENVAEILADRSEKTAETEAADTKETEAENEAEEDDDDVTIPCTCATTPEEGDNPCCCDITKDCCCPPMSCDYSESPVLKVRLLKQLKQKLTDAEANLADLQCQIAVLTESMPNPITDVCKKRPYAAIYQEIMKDTTSVDELMLSNKQAACGSNTKQEDPCGCAPPPTSVTTCCCAPPDPPLTMHYLNPNASNKICTNEKQKPKTPNKPPLVKENTFCCCSTTPTTTMVQPKCPPSPKSQTTLIQECIDELLMDAKKKQCP